MCVCPWLHIGSYRVLLVRSLTLSSSSSSLEWASLGCGVAVIYERFALYSLGMEVSFWYACSALAWSALGWSALLWHVLFKRREKWRTGEGRREKGVGVATKLGTVLLSVSEWVLAVA